MKIIWCDNTWETVAFQKEAENEDLGLVFEYIAPDTPQQNGRVERKFQTLYGRVRAMLYGVGLDISKIKKLWAEAAATVTELDGFIVWGNETRSAFQKIFGKGKKRIVNITKKFGQRCISTKQDKMKAKLSARGIVMHWV